MKILIAYASKTGATKKAAQLLQERLYQGGAETELCDLASASPVLEGYDGIAIGGSIRMGMIHHAASQFIKRNQAQLLERPLGLFCCRCGKDDTRALLAKQLPPALMEHAVAVDSFGGELNMAQQKGFDRFIVKMVSKANQENAMTPEGILEPRITAFASDLLKALQNG